MVDVTKIENLLKKHFDIRGTVNVDANTGKVDVQGEVLLKDKFKLTRLPVQFGHVTGNFICDDKKLLHLQGAPASVGGDFYCDHNQLTHLQGAPASVAGSFYCQDNKLTHLQGAPASVGGHFSCNDNQLTHLKDAPASVGGHFRCHGNPLVNLQGAPTSVGGNFYCDYNPHLSLLRVLNYTQFAIFEAPDLVTQIMKRYAGTGKAGAIKAAVELVQAGYKDNARW